VYDSKVWSHGNENIPLSGSGSTVERTVFAAHAIRSVLMSYGLKSIIDAPCGDFTWMQKLIPYYQTNNISYYGIDIVPTVISKLQKDFTQQKFKVVDIVREVPPKADLIFCREALQHLNAADVLRALENFNKSGAKYLLTTTYLLGNNNKGHISHGDNTIINLFIEPYHLVPPVAMFTDYLTNHDNIHMEYLGLWELPLKYKK